MAVDEAIFRERIRTKAPPTLRFYGWRTPAVSVGHNQDAREIDIAACRGLGIAIVRRPTGGKAVLHERELTYAVIAGDDVPPFPPDILETYRIISDCIGAGLAVCGIRAEMQSDGRGEAAATLSNSCFAFPSRYELLVGGRKICGAAQVRSCGVFLQHGALLLAFDPVRTCALMLPHRDRAEQVERLRNSVTSVGEHAGPEADEAFEKSFALNPERKALAMAAEHQQAQ
ncbi:MAG: lipoate--protein ligase family protein, partial [Proteobacteria bacterium]|nr:lipoate--protein ligase family protein [Pseudomonadota bacterium]